MLPLSSNHVTAATPARLVAVRVGTWGGAFDPHGVESLSCDVLCWVLSAVLLFLFADRITEINFVFFWSTLPNRYRRKDSRDAVDILNVCLVEGLFYFL